RPLGIDASDLRAVTVRVADANAQRATARARRRLRLRGLLFVALIERRLRLLLQRIERHVERLLLAAAQDLEVHVGPGRVARHDARQLLGVCDVRAVDADDEVALLEARLGGRAVPLDLAYQ